MLGEKTRGDRAAHVERVVGAIRGAHLSRRNERWSLRLQRHRATEGTVAIGRRAHAALYLHRAEQRGIGVHVGPEHALVLGRIQGHAVEGDVDARVAGTADAHVGGTGAQSVFAPCQHARRAREEEGQLLTRGGEALQFFPVDLGNGKRSILLGAHAAYYYFLQLLDGERVSGIGLRPCRSRWNKGQRGPCEKMFFHCSFTLFINMK